MKLWLKILLISLATVGVILYTLYFLFVVMVPSYPPAPTCEGPKGIFEALEHVKNLHAREVLESHLYCR